MYVLSKGARKLSYVKTPYFESLNIRRVSHQLRYFLLRGTKQQKKNLAFLTQSTFFIE